MGRVYVEFYFSSISLTSHEHDLVIEVEMHCGILMVVCNVSTEFTATRY